MAKTVTEQTAPEQDAPESTEQDTPEQDAPEQAAEQDAPESVKVESPRAMFGKVGAFSGKPAGAWRGSREALWNAFDTDGAPERAAALSDAERAAALRECMAHLSWALGYAGTNARMTAHAVTYRERFPRCIAVLSAPVAPEQAAEQDAPDSAEQAAAPVA